MKNFQHMAYNYRRRSAGAVIAETLIAIPVLFMLVMGAV
jgi:Flp pilus assembly protein TadG